MKRAVLILAAVGLFLPPATGCEEDGIPKSVRVAATACCERWIECDHDAYGGSVEECVQVTIGYIDWGAKSRDCIDARIACWECRASAPCDSDPCELTCSLTGYNCRRADTGRYGVMCFATKDPEGLWRDECYERCYAEYGPDTLIGGAPCTAETPDWCDCGVHECGSGWYCCYCDSLHF